MREDLMAYVLGELDEPDRRKIEQELATDASLRAEVETIRRCLSEAAAGSGDECDELPSGLADRIADDIPRWVSGSCEDGGGAQEPSHRSEYAPGACSFTMVDMTVAMAVLLAIGSLLMPSLNTSRSDSQRLACQNNLRELGTLFTQYSEERSGFMPLIAPNEHAGIYSIRLAEADVASHQMLGRLVVCPASPLSSQLRRRGKPLVIPTAEELKSAQGAALLRIRRTSGGSYAVQLGYVKDGYYIPMLNRRHSWVPVLSDSPDLTASRDAGANHGGKITNTLFQDGSVHPLTTCIVSRNHDHLFLNEEGQPFAGQSWTDAMMSPSPAAPSEKSLELPWAVRLKFLEL